MIKKIVIQKLTIAGKEYEYPDTTAFVEKINELCNAVNDLHEEAENNARIRANHEKQIDELQMKLEPEKNDEPGGFTPEMMDEIRYKTKIPVVTDDTSQNLIGENIELKAENIRLRQDLDRVCNKRFEELDAAVRESNKNLFAKNEKLNTALNHCVKIFKSFEQVLNEKASASDIPDNPDLYAWAVRIKPIWSELKEITGIDYTKGGDNE